MHVLFWFVLLASLCGQANGEVSSQHIVAKDNWGGGVAHLK